jgi:hypothetical protein
MRTLRILFAKELNATLTSPIGYTVAAVFLLVLGYTFSLTLFVTKVANLQYIFHQMYVLSILLVPVLTMRTFAEDRNFRTDAGLRRHPRSLRRTGLGTDLRRLSGAGTPRLAAGRGRAPDVEHHREPGRRRGALDRRVPDALVR